MNLTPFETAGINRHRSSDILGFRAPKRCCLRRTVVKPKSLFTSSGRAQATNSTETSTGSRLANRGDLRLYLDSASVLQWDKWIRTGLLYGEITVKHCQNVIFDGVSNFRIRYHVDKTDSV
jgi:hypothetical protein